MVEKNYGEFVASIVVFLVMVTPVLTLAIDILLRRMKRMVRRVKNKMKYRRL